jgi:hypothetical protein
MTRIAALAADARLFVSLVLAGHHAPRPLVVAAAGRVNRPLLPYIKP